MKPGIGVMTVKASFLRSILIKSFLVTALGCRRRSQVRSEEGEEAQSGRFEVRSGVKEALNF